MARRDRFRAAVAGAAIGDCIGYQVEFARVSEIRRRFGPEGVTDFSARALVSDDTQMSCALAEGLLDARGSANPDVVMPHVTRRFVEWSVSPENTRAPGGTCMAGCRALERGVDWRESGVVGSKGCGAAMRVAPIGLVYRSHDTIAEIARATAICTHSHPTAVAAAHAAALAVRLLLGGIEPPDLLQHLSGETGGRSSEWDEMLSRVPLALEATRRGIATPEEVQRLGSERWRLGEGWVADEAVACALYCFRLAHERDEGYRETVLCAANTDGDSDSLATIAGSMAGAYWSLGGEMGVPEEWIERVEKSDHLIDLADRLYGLVSR